MDADSDLTLGERIRRLRRAAGLSQEELAARAGLSLRSVSNLERDAPHTPRRETLRLLTEALGLSGDEREQLLGKAPARALPAPPPPRSTIPHNLPAAPGPLIGRATEVATARGELRRRGTRLLTLTGTGGVGKTRLAVAVAEEARPAFPDGVWFVDLSPIGDPELVPGSVVQALGLRFAGDRPAAAVLIEHLRARRALLVLDNFEQVLPAAKAVADVLAACPEVQVLATSREPLRLRWEHLLQVPPLPLPTPEDLGLPERLARVPAVALFVERARAAARRFSLDAVAAPAVAAICARLDGLPLAIELAAARVVDLSPPEILARLEPCLPLLRWDAHDLPDRHRTLRATIGWSNDLLAPAEQALFRRLGVFVGGFTAEAAARVADASALGLDADEGLRCLAERSLVRVLVPGDEPRFGLLETVRDYARERLVATGEAEATAARHLADALALAERTEPDLTGPDQVQCLDRLEAAHDDLRAALRWALATGASAAGLRLAASLARFWWLRGHVEEGAGWLERALAKGATAPPATRAAALAGAGHLAYRRGRFDHARELHAEGLALSRTLGDPRGVAQGLSGLGRVALSVGDYGRAVDLFEESLELTRASEPDEASAQAVLALGVVLEAQGDIARAAVRYEEALALFRTLGHQAGIAGALGNLAGLARDRGEIDHAQRLYEEVLALQRSFGHTPGVAMTLGNLGEVAWGRGDDRTALALCWEALRLTQELGDVPSVAFNLDLIAGVAQRHGDADRATRLWTAAAALREAIGFRTDPEYVTKWDPAKVAARSSLGETAFAAATAAGRAMSVEEAVAGASAVSVPA